MASPQARLEAAILIDSYGADSALVTLAQLASPACRIELQLLRRLRLGCVPEADVSVEQALWFSELVDARGRTITLRDTVAQVLRERLRKVRQVRAAVVARARLLMEQIHAELSPILMLEERLAWAEVYDDDSEIEQGARTLLQSLLSGREGLDHWLGRAWSNLPQDLKRTPEGQRLAQVAAARGARIEQVESAPDMTGLSHLLKAVMLPLARDGGTLAFDVDPQSATHVIDIPATRPKALAVRSDAGSWEVVLDGSDPVVIEVGSGAVTLRTLTGDEYELEPVQTPHVFDLEMLAAGPGTSLLIRYGTPDEVHQILVDCGSRRTGRLLAERLRALASLRLELLVLTHIDDDRIGGAIALLEDTTVSLQVGDVWFNAFELIDRELL